MVETVDTAGVRRALEQARGQRTQITRGAPLPIDTAHVVGACPTCGTLGVTILGFPDPPYAGPQGQPRYRNAKELGRFLEEIVRNPPALPSPEDPSVPSKNPQQPAQWQGVCKCGTKVIPPTPDPKTGKMVGDPEAIPRRVCGLRFIKAMPGSGAELVVEALSGDGGTLWTTGVPIAFKIYRHPLDGVEISVSATLDDDSITTAFGRPLTLAETWREILAKAMADEEVLVDVEPGYWLWAGPAKDVSLNAKIKAIIDDNPACGSFDITTLGGAAPVPQGPSWPQWGYEAAPKLRDKTLRAGVILDRSVVAKLIEAQVERMSLAWREENQGQLVVVQSGEIRWPVEVAIVSLGAAHLGWTFGETTSAAVGEAMGRVNDIKRFVDAARKDRPDITFQIDGLRASTRRADGSYGRPLNLMDVPFRAPPGSPDFKRELRFVCDDLPKGANPTRLCPCGEKAWLSAKIFPTAVVEEFKKATNGKSPRVIEEWKGAVLIATISCDRHVRIPMHDEIEGAGLAGDAFNKRMAEDLPNSIFAVDVSLHEDKSGKRALLAYGPLVASVVINDHLVGGLHQACRLQDGALPLRSDEVSALVVTPNVLCLSEPGFDDDRLDQVLEIGAAMDNIPVGVDPPFDLSWDVSLKAAPVGRFQNLRPQPQGQQQQQQQQPPPGATNGARPR